MTRKSFIRTILVGTCMTFTFLGYVSAADSIGETPIMDMSASEFYTAKDGVTYEGGLYGNGSNSIPSGHANELTQATNNIVPRDINGNPTDSGTIGMISIGMSNTSQEFTKFVKLIEEQGGTSESLVMINGAQGGIDSKKWLDDSFGAYTTLAQRIDNAGVSKNQIQAVWLKQAYGGPQATDPNHIQTLASNIQTIITLLSQEYPNIKVVYLSSRIYAGYATGTLNPEPYAYESGFSVREVILGQINGTTGLGYNTIPVVAWGPYMWADGTTPRSDGLTWVASDYAADGTHPGAGEGQAQDKVATMLYDFFTTDEYAATSFTGNPVGSGGGTVGSVDECVNDYYTQTMVVPFPDIQFDTFESYIQRLHCREVVGGYSDGTYKPGNNVTRAEMAKFVVNAFDIPILTTGSQFPDVSSSHTFYSYIQTLNAHGIVGGYSDGTFKPDETLTRGQLTKFISNAMEYKGISTTSSGTNSFSDVAADNVFLEYIVFLANYSSDGETIIGGYSDGTFRPDVNVTRGAMAKVVMLSSKQFE